MAEVYKRNPCGTLSVPYWKSKWIAVPENMHIVHDREYCAAQYAGYVDEPYFRLFHDLKDMQTPRTEEIRMVTAKQEDLTLLADVINRSYDDLSVTCEQLESYTQTEVYHHALWVMAVSRRDGCVMGCGIADLDREMREGILEWIQVLPKYRRRGVGRAIVNELLIRMKQEADFATVSGKVCNATKPERLYWACGFTGEDVWHILVKKDLG